MVDNRDLGWHSDFALLSESKLAHFGLSPAKKLAILGDRERKESSSLNMSYGFAVEALDVLRNGGDLDALGEAKLSFEATAPSIDICAVGKDQRVRLSTCDFHHSLVSHRLQDHRRQHLLRATMASCTKSSRSKSVDVAVSGQVELVVSAADDLLEVAHLVCLHVGSVLVVEGEHAFVVRLHLLAVLLLFLLMMILVLLKGRPLLVLTQVVLGVAESLAVCVLHVLHLGLGCVGTLHVLLPRNVATWLLTLTRKSCSSVRSLRPVSGVSQTFPLLDFLIDMRELLLQMHVLLVEWRHAELLVAHGLILSSRWPLVVRVWPLVVSLVPRLNRH